MTSADHDSQASGRSGVRSLRVAAHAIAALVGAASLGATLLGSRGAIAAGTLGALVVLAASAISVLDRQ